MTESISYDVAVIGAGFSGISAAIRLARLGRSVLVLERHAQPGGRARTYEKDGFVYDMGPSWYWMPDVFENTFRMGGSRVEAHYDLVRLDPSYRVWFEDSPLDVPAGRPAMEDLFESLEHGAGARLSRFLDEAERKYRLGMDRFVLKPGHSPLEFCKPDVIPHLLRLSMFGSLSAHVRSQFRHPKLIRLLEFPVLFLGARPEETPALYSLMNYADISLGTWYPMGGMHRVIRGLVETAEALGVEFRYEAEVDAIMERDDRLLGVRYGDTTVQVDAVVASADYHHVEQRLLPRHRRRYDDAYWSSRVMAPGAQLFFVGLDRRVPELAHHNLFFDVPFEPHAQAIYDEPSWPEKPQFYVCAPSRTDASVAPEGCENLFILVPLAAGLDDDDGAGDRLFEVVFDRIGNRIGYDLRPHVVVRRDYAHRDFASDYHAYAGNAYGLANTLTQTAFLKPKMRSRLPGVYFTGQLTTPGPGVPPSLISGRVAADEVDRWLARHRHSEVA